MKISRFSIVLAAALAVVSILPACSVLKALGDPKYQLAEQLTVQTATTKFIEAQKSPDAQLKRAKDVAKVAVQLKEVVQSESATVDALRALAFKKIGEANLQPSDHLLANTLVEATVQALHDKLIHTTTDANGNVVTVGVLDPDAKIAVNKILDWIISATELYG